jgi:predicted transposase/invertase (TIGR01784 family)
MPTEHPGVYHLPQGQEAGMIVTHHLLPTEDTMWLRILGRNGNQQRAIQEFATKPNRNELYVSIEERLADYRANLADNQKITQEDEELIMQLSALYRKQQQEWKEKGIQEGIQEGIQVGVKAGLKAGRLEEQQRVAIALLKEGLSPELIAKTTGLSTDTIHQLQT